MRENLKFPVAKHVLAQGISYLVTVNCFKIFEKISRNISSTIGNVFLFSLFPSQTEKMLLVMDRRQILPLIFSEFKQIN